LKLQKNIAKHCLRAAEKSDKLSEKYEDAPPQQAKGSAMPYGTVRPYLLPLLLSALWCLLLLMLLQRGMQNEESHATELARLQARTLCAQMLDTRAWNAAHGGVYVRESEYGAANPWIPEEMRRAMLANGERMVLINPAYMSRQIADRSSTRGARLRITSSNPLRPENQADAWEEAALRSISLGQHEVFKLDASTPGPQNFRYMAPLRAEADCLYCHTNNRLHDVRGGISVTLEAAPFLQTIEEYNTALSYTYAIMGLAGTLGIGSLSFAINRKRLLAEHKERMNSAFLANMSHDMRTPLTGIMGMAELLQEETEETKKRQACRYLRSAAAALLDMVTDITTHAALDTGKLQCAHHAFSPRESLEACLELFRPACAEKGLNLKLIIVGELPPLLVGDAFRLRQALGNLVGNAVNFTQRGGIRVEAECESADGTQCMLHLRVRDSGPGIAPEEQAHIFERFARGSQDQIRNTPGTGLGLSITRELAVLMGGTLSLESTPGEGSCFTFSVRCALPASSGNAPACRDTSSDLLFAPLTPHPRVHPPLNAAPFSEDAEKPPKALRIVLAEDNKVSAYFLQEVLRQAGHSVAAAGDGFEALALLRNSPADLAILDIRMPGMNGLELAERIRQGDAGVDPALPIISITASRSEEAQARLRQLGVHLQAEKPLSSQQLLQLIASACGTSNARSAPSAKESVFDLAAALEKVEGKHALLRKLAAILLEDLPQQELALARAVEQNDLPQIHYLAHALKNSAAMLQLRQLKTGGERLENAAHARRDCRQAWQSLQEALSPARAALLAYVDKRMDAL
jgi:signal transduction histidine kinase/DNA-binding response OmpR family regulator